MDSLPRPAQARTARARARAAITDEIKSAARSQLTEVGSAGLSVRAVARELGMASSAVYRYFPSRDSLLTALIIDAFDAVGAVAETAAGDRRTGFIGRWVAVALAIRGWALAHPHDYALVYGSPVPGYQAPQDTVASALRVSLVGLGIVADGVAAGEIDPTAARSIPRVVHSDLARLREEAAPGLGDEVLARCLLAWTTLFGSISYELFGHFEGVVNHRDEFFAHQMRRTAAFVAGTGGL